MYKLLFEVNCCSLSISVLTPVITKNKKIKKYKNPQ